MNTATVADDGTAVVHLDGQPAQQVQAATVAQARKQAVALVLEHARQTGAPVTLLARDTDTEHLLDVRPDGSVHPATPTPVVAVHPPARTTPNADVKTPRRRRWALVTGALLTIAGAGLCVVALGSSTQQSPAQSAPAVPEPAAGVISPDSLGVLAAARTPVPKPLRLPGTRERVPWAAAAGWQSTTDAARRRAQARAETSAIPAPVPAPQYQAPAAPAPQYQAPAAPAPVPAAPKTRQPQGSVKVYPDPEINPN